MRRGNVVRYVCPRVTPLQGLVLDNERRRASTRPFQSVTHGCWHALLSIGAPSLSLVTDVLKVVWLVWVLSTTCALCSQGRVCQAPNQRFGASWTARHPFGGGGASSIIRGGNSGIVAILCAPSHPRAVTYSPCPPVYVLATDSPRGSPSCILL